MQYIVGKSPSQARLMSLTTLQGDTKYGVLVGTDRYGNKYFENLEEDLPLRTRWVRPSGDHDDQGESLNTHRLITRTKN